jgi:hypothetical protein
MKREREREREREMKKEEERKKQMERKCWPLCEEVLDGFVEKLMERREKEWKWDW